MNFESTSVRSPNIAMANRPVAQRAQSASINKAPANRGPQFKSTPYPAGRAMQQQTVLKKLGRPGVQSANVLMGKSRQACPTCGSQRQGCTTLAGFANNSAALSPQHKQQLRRLAFTLLKTKSNSVVASGYSSNPKVTPHTTSLSKRRAIAVIAELKRLLAQLRPNALKNILWKALAKQNLRTAAPSPAANNRRVVVCVRKI